jgi:hypothetical protein
MGNVREGRDEPGAKKRFCALDCSLGGHIEPQGEITDVNEAQILGNLVKVAPFSRRVFSVRLYASNVWKEAVRRAQEVVEGEYVLQVEKT